MKTRITSVVFKLVGVCLILIAGAQWVRADITQFPPAAKTPQVVVRPTKPTIRVEKDRVLLENSYFAAVLSTKSGIMLERLFNKQAGSECLLKNKSSALFSVLSSAPESEEWIDSARFDVVKKNLDVAGKVKQLTLTLRCEKPRLNAEFLIRLQDSEEMEYSLKINNAGAQAGKFSVMFPLLERLVIGDNPEDNYYFYPFCGGWSSNRAYEIAGVYGTSSGSLQLMSVFSPRLGGGVYVYVKDSSGAGKVTRLRKSNAPGEAVPSYIPFWGPETKREPAYAPQPFPIDIGTSLGLRTFRLKLEPGQTIALPNAVVGVYAGDFRQPLESYTKWVRTWWQPPNPPQWLKASFNFSSVHDVDSLREGRYVAKTGTLSARDQVYQWSPWWKQSVFDRDGRNPRADRFYSWNIGDYDYEERWGGLPALRKEIERFHKGGSRMTLLVQSYLVWKYSKVAKEHWPEWGYLNPDGKYNEDYSDPPGNCWGMCTRYEEWQDYIAGVCARAIRETGADGIYLDSAPNVGFDCRNPNHHHEGDPAVDVKRYFCKVRDAIRQENPEAILWVEHPSSDYLMQFSDMTWLSTFASPLYANFNDYGLHFLRFYFPELKYAEWNGDSSKPELWRQTFFNGIGMGISYGFPDYMARTGQIMRENSKAFNSLHPEPLILTEKKGVFANLFPAEEKNIYTVWNRNRVIASGGLLNVAHRKDCHYVELLSGQEVEFETKGKQDLLNLEITPREVACVAQFPRLLEVKRQGDKLYVSLLRPSEKSETRIFCSTDPDDPGIVLPPDDRVVELAAEVGGKMTVIPSRVIIKLLRDGELLDQVNITKDASGLLNP